MTAKKRVLLVLGLMLCCVAQAAPKQDTDPKAERLESKADKVFIRGDFDRAIKTYEKAEDMLPTGIQKYNLELKMARLFVLLQMPEKAVDYYTTVFNASDTMLTVNDVCFYLDALRQSDDAQTAEVIARRYAFKSSHSRNQRYMNALYALSNQHYYYAKGESDYGVEMVGQHTDLPEYWVGEWDGKLFYAASRSRMQDPLKIYYHQTQYFLMDDGGNMMENFRNIPRDLHSGPVAFTQDKGLMIATGINYRSTSRIVDITSNNGLFVNQLYYSTIDKKNNRWSRFEPLFESQETSNYAHPTFFNDDKSLIFSSDRPGGYGGMDLYIAHWDDATQKWGVPINMGPLVNTQGDEVYPRMVDDGLYFSSNGLEGYGGYDLYRVTFGHNMVLPGSLFHYPYPINSVYNDFGVFFNGDDMSTGYFVSDRGQDGTKDNIYRFNNAMSALNSENVVGVSQEYSAMRGDLNTIIGLRSSNTETFQKDLVITPIHRVPEKGELLLSVYFDFNKSVLTRESRRELDELLSNHSMDYVSELFVVGYADDLGAADYNKRLSERRAETVGNYLTAHNGSLTLYVEGRGQLSMTQEEMQEAMADMPEDALVNVELQNAPKSLSLEDRIRLRSKLRRVDIMVPRN